MKQTFAILIGCSLWLNSAVGAAPEPAYKLFVVTDRPNALYSCGEKVRFRVSLTASNAVVDAATVNFRLDHDGMPPVQDGVLTLTNGLGVIESTLKEPGFLSCRITYTNAGFEALKAVAAAGYEPRKLKPSLPVPDDFDAFWESHKAQLRAVPMQPVITNIPSPVKNLECFDVQINCHTGRPVSGYFARPIGAVPGSLPAILSVQGAGVRSSILGEAVRNAGYGAIAMDINAHGLPNGKPDEFYKEIYLGELRDYQLQGREDREKCYFLGMFLREIRALDFLTRQPEWDGKHLIVIGGSQGGGQAIAAGGLDSRVTLICASIPALCDHSGPVVGRPSGWPHIVPMRDGQLDPNILQQACYFDCMNFATRVKADACFGVGFIDTVCPPSSSYAAFNALPGKKQIINEPLKGHDGSMRINQAFVDAIKADFQKR